MKVLVVSLLRIGDLFMHIEMMNQWKEISNSNISFLINDECQGAIPILRQVGYSHFIFPRKEIQKTINQSRTHLLEPIWCIQDLVEELNKSKWDLVLNLTHTRVSGYLSFLLNSTNKRGLVATEEHLFLLNGNSILKEFNNKYTELTNSPRHYLEWLADSFNLPIKKPTANFQKGKIYLQIFTSDSKKNWSILKWKSVFDQIKNVFPDYEIKILASDKEKHEISSYWTLDQIEILSLFDAFLEFQKASLLVACDTSLIHLASLARCPSIMLSLGSSNKTKTFPFLLGSQVISSEIPCRPCRHDDKCSRSTHECSDDLNESQVVRAIINQISNLMNFNQKAQKEFAL